MSFLLDCIGQFASVSGLLSIAAAVGGNIEERRMRRRDFLKVSGAAIGALAMNRAAMAQGSPELVFNGAGGTWQENARKSWLTPFREKAGVKVIHHFPFDTRQLDATGNNQTTAGALTRLSGA